MAYAVLRCAKVKANQVSKVHNHNLRTYENRSAENVNFDRNQNKLILGSANTHNKLKENLSKLESKKAIRKDANVLLEFIFSASPDFFYDDLDKDKFDKLTMKTNKSELDRIFNERLNRDNLDKFKKAVIEFIDSKEEFRDNVVNLVLHLDEKTPHFHLTLTPILNKRLTAKEFFTPEKARAWQDDFHSVLQQNNIVLERGKEFSPAIHQTLAEYRSNEPVDLPEPPNVVVPGRVLPTEIGKKVPFTDKVITTTTDLESITKQLQRRESIQKKHYDFYKSFYNETKELFKNAKQALKENEVLKTKNEKLK
ncbi:MAG: plasmid recombination protein, partial [Sulfurihydrogenibium sp.]|nr:plasmid recombination protein [Sulfurihydrogenibium sp.]